MNDTRSIAVTRLWIRRIGILALDATIAAGSLWVAMILRFEGQIPDRFLTPLPALTLVLVVSRVIAAVAFRLQRWSFLLSSLPDGLRVGYAGVLGSGLFVTGIFLLRLQSPPRSTVVMELLLSTGLMGLVRFLPRLAHSYRADMVRSRRAVSVRTLIVGAGATGAALLRDLQRSEEHDYSVMGFVDDDSSKRGTIINSRPVLGSVANLPSLIVRNRIGKVLIAIPRLPPSQIREILSECADLKVQFKILPVSYIYLEERVPSVMLQDLSPEDLLSRELVDFSQEAQSNNVASHTVLVTGAAGSIGSEICRQLLLTGVRRLVMVDINENGLYLLQRKLESEFDAEVVAEIGNIRESGRINNLFAHYRPQDVFHAAAHKHVPLMEASPCEAVKNNVLGTRVVAEAALAFGSERLILISTDKAVRPSSVMGATKRVAELLVRGLAEGSSLRLCTVRFGNVLDSAASVVPIFRQQIASGGPVTVTHPEVRRYFMTISEAVGLVLKATYGEYGQLCALEMGEQIRIYDLARHMITMSGLVPDIDIPILFTGLRPGEKIFEELLTEEEERTRRVVGKIHVLQSSLPSSAFASELESLLDAAAAEDVAGVLEGLHAIVTSFPSVHLSQIKRSGDGTAVRLH